MRSVKTILFIFFALSALTVTAQTCPDNIDFKEGTFNHWVCKTGSVDRSGVVDLNATGVVTGRHTIISNHDPDMDPYGKFSVVSPNGNAYSIKLGNNNGGAQAERVSYTYSIPADKQDYVFTYYYAVVLQLTNHLDFERPRFAVKLTDLTTNADIACGTHDFVSNDGLSDFKTSNDGVAQYRDWSTVAVNLAGRAGHTVRFDFTTNDCVYTVHFGYAYLAFDDPCVLNNEPITGGNYCRGTGYVNLKAPLGFGSYQWHEAGKTDVLGGDQNLLLFPIPADGTKYVVDAVSYSGVGAGCPASFSTTIHKVDEDFILNVKANTEGCASVGIDLTNPTLTATSSAGMTFKYYEDANGQTFIRDPTKVVRSGTYYIRGTNTSGCTDIKPITVTAIPDPAVVITPPKPVCKPATVNLTDPAIVGGLNQGLTYTYFADADATVPLANPRVLTVSNTYYIKITNVTGCSQVLPVIVIISDLPVINPSSISGCAPLDITLHSYQADYVPEFTYTYFKDAAATIPVAHPEKVTEQGTYYTLVTNEYGCTTGIAVPLNVTIYPAATLNLAATKQVQYPATVDLTTAYTTNAGYTYSYYTDSLLTTALPNFKTVAESGKYFVKAVTANGCQLIKSVIVTITAPEDAALLAKNTFTPNGDGINDEFSPVMQGVATINYLKVYNRNGSLIFETKDLASHWKGTLNGALVPSGVYYWVFSCYDVYRKKEVTNSGSVAVIR